MVGTGISSIGSPVTVLLEDGEDNGGGMSRGSTLARMRGEGGVCIRTAIDDPTGVIYSVSGDYGLWGGDNANGS